MIKVTDGNQSPLHSLLEATLSEYLMVHQRLCLEGSEQDLQKLREFADSCLQHYIKVAVSGKPMVWNFDLFEQTWAESQERPTRWLKADLIEYVVYNLGDHKSSMHTGVKWHLEEDQNGLMRFSSVFTPSVKFSQLTDAKNNFPFIEEITLNQEGLFIKYNEVEHGS